jgi:selenocysteine lyase/cysteine desulfurase
MNNKFKKLREYTIPNRRGLMNGPFGTKFLVYADSTASGIIYQPITNYMIENVYPFYSNTHSNAITGKYMSELIEKSKQIIRNHYNCDSDGDQIIFTGNGCTGAILHLIHAMDLQKSNQNIVVFVSITEHHSNYLPWKHLKYPLELVPVNQNGHLDENFIISRMKYYYDQKTKIIASFSGASNVSGILEDWSKISKIVHSFGGIMLWDMAACAPYVKINMHKDDAQGDYMDAIFCSPHKFLGGPGCPGLLIAHKKLFVNQIPYCPGGGTVRFVCKKYQVYNPNIEIKETGGTPNILGCIQMGKVFELKNEIQDYIHHKESIIYKYCYQILKNIPNLILIRPDSINIDSLPIFSFIIKNYHCNLVVVLLNDLFGIQSRGGVSCCSVFAQNILHLNDNDQEKIYQSIEQGSGVPTNYGWCRVSFHYLMSREEINYILQSIYLISIFINKLSKYYIYDPIKNNWNYKTESNSNFPSSRLHISEIPYTNYDLQNNMKETLIFLNSLK